MHKFLLIFIAVPLTACTLKQHSGQHAETATQTACIAEIRKQIPDSVDIEVGDETTVKVQGTATTSGHYTVEFVGRDREVTCQIRNENGHQGIHLDWGE